MAGKGHNETDKEESVQVHSPRPDQPITCIKSCIMTRAEKNQWLVTVIDDSLLSGREAHVCTPDPLFREVCCLPGVQIREITRKLTSLVQTLDYYPLLFFHMLLQQEVQGQSKETSRPW